MARSRKDGCVRVCVGEGGGAHYILDEESVSGARSGRAGLYKKSYCECLKR